MDKSREDFEAWCADEMGNTVGFINDMRRRNIHGIDCYGRDEINKRWRAWQASRKALVVTVPTKVMEEDEFDKGHNCAIDYCAEAIREAGITVKGEGDE